MLEQTLNIKIYSNNKSTMKIFCFTFITNICHLPWKEFIQCFNTKQLIGYLQFNISLITKHALFILISINASIWSTQKMIFHQQKRPFTTSNKNLIAGLEQLAESLPSKKSSIFSIEISISIWGMVQVSNISPAQNTIISIPKVPCSFLDVAALI